MVATGHYAFLWVPEGLFCGEGNNPVNLIYVKGFTGAVVVFNN